MLGRNVLCAALFGFAALPLFSTGRPAAARPAAPDFTGTYVGGCTSRSGSTWSTDLSIYQQLRSRVAAKLSIAALYPEVTVTGVCSRAGRLTLTGTHGSGPARARIHLRGTYLPATDLEAASITGEFRVSGPRAHRGTFRLVGGGAVPAPAFRFTGVGRE